MRNYEIEDRLRSYPNELISSFGLDTGDETEAAGEVLKEEEVLDGEARGPVEETSHQFPSDPGTPDVTNTTAHPKPKSCKYPRLINQVEARRIVSYNIATT